MFRKNKDRKHICGCGYSNLNNYFGYKSYNKMPVYLIDFYDMYKKKCVWCGETFYYLVKKEDK